MSLFMINVDYQWITVVAGSYPLGWDTGSGKNNAEIC